MALRTIYPEWRAANQKTKYPFAETATLTNAGGGFIAEDVFLDLALYPIGGQERMFLSKVVIDSETITVYFGDSGNKARCSGSFDLAEPASTLALADKYGRPAGVIVSQPELLAQLQALGLGTHEFGVTATEICATCIMPTPEIGVRGFLLEDGTVVAGKAWLVGEDGVVLTKGEVTTDDACGSPVTETVIRVDVVGDPLYRRRLCDPIELFVTPRFLTKLRVMVDCELLGEITPDEHGNIHILQGSSLASDTVLRIRPNDQGLKIEMVGG